jgi:hypothetical protein
MLGTLQRIQGLISDARAVLNAAAQYRSDAIVQDALRAAQAAVEAVWSIAVSLVPAGSTMRPWRR